MKIKAIKLYENGFMTQPFALGGEEGMENFDKNVKYHSSLQNYLIDTGEEVILIDTGMPAETPQTVPDENSMIFMGTKIASYVDALAKEGYKPEDVSKILVTHKHGDHTGELRAFPNAKVYVGPEDAEELNVPAENLVKATYSDGPYYNFPASQKIADGIYYIQAKGHTNGNSIVIAESDGLFYMFHGDVTYTDEALYENKLSIVFEDKEKARETLNHVRDFIQNHPTVYLSTHTPLGYENLEERRVVDLAVPTETKPIGDIVYKTAAGKYICLICGYEYDPAENDGVAFEDLPEDWVCPMCGQGKEQFEKE